MKKILLGFSLFLFLLQLPAQVTFCPPGAKWNYSFYDGYYDGAVFNEAVSYVNDSLVDNDSVKVLRHNWFFKSFSPLGGNGKTYLKQNGDTVFMKNAWTNHQWQILYNFAALPGQSWTNVFPGIAHYTTTVNSVNTVTIGGLSLKQLQVSYSNYLAIPFMSATSVPYQGLITERLGSDGFIFNYFCGVNTHGPSLEHYLCYTDNQMGLQSFTDRPCNYSNLNDLNEWGNTLSLKIYPNPINDKLTIQSDETLVFSLIDIKGCQVLPPTPYNKTINTAELRPGIYFLQLYREKQLIHTHKLIKVE